MLLINDMAHQNEVYYTKGKTWMTVDSVARIINLYCNMTGGERLICQRDYVILDGYSWARI